jgi:vesicle-associated membrane protein 7
MDHYNTTEIDSLTRVHDELEYVRAVMLDGIDKLAPRGERIVELRDKTEALDHESVQFKKKAIAVRKAEFYRHWKVIVISVLGLLLVLFGVFLYFCTGFECIQKL